MKMTAKPVAYIRRSARSTSDPGDLSRELQTDEVRRLAGADGPTLAILDADWGKSAATDATDKRLAFLGLLESIERGEVSTLYAYSTDRLARSVQWAARLLDACEKAGATIVTGEGRFEPGDDMARQLFQFQAITNENYSRQAKKKRAATVARIRARGDKMGPTFYGSLPGESLDAVLATFDQVGSAHGTAIRLNREGIVKTRRGGPWTQATVRQILVREGRVPKLGVRGAKPRADHRLYRLLRCHCGHVMTAVKVRWGGGATIYRCVNGAADPGHSIKSVAESKLLPAIIAEGRRLTPPVDAVRIAAQRDAEQQALVRRRDGIGDAYAAGAFGAVRSAEAKAKLTERLREVEERLDAIADAATIAVIPASDWDASPAELNALLRSPWSPVRPGPDMLPGQVGGRNPALSRPPLTQVPTGPGRASPRQSVRRWLPLPCAGCRKPPRARVRRCSDPGESDQPGHRRSRRRARSGPLRC